LKFILALTTFRTREDTQQLELDDDADLLQHDDHDDIASLKKQLSNIVPALEIASEGTLGPTTSANAMVYYDSSSFVYCNAPIEIIASLPT
jgi:hypothetical protein